MDHQRRLQLIIDAQTRGFQLGVKESQSALRGLRRDHTETGLAARRMAMEERGLNRALDEQSRKLRGLTLQYSVLRRAMLTLAVQTAITGLAGLTATISALVNGLIMLTSSLAGAGSALGIFATAGLMAVGQGAIVAALGLRKVSKALTTTGTDHEKAMAKLTKPARAFVGQIGQMRHGFREMQLLSQKGMFPGLVKGLKEMQPFLGKLRVVFYDTARVIGYLGQRLGEVVHKHGKDLFDMGERNVVTFRRLGDSLLHFGGAFIDFFRAADPLIGHMTKGLLEFSKNVEDAAHKARADGGLASFFWELRKSFDEWMHILKDVGLVIFNVLKAAAPAAHEMNAAITGVLDKWVAWTGDTAGQSRMSKFFHDSLKPLGAMAKFIGAFFQTWVHLTGNGNSAAVQFFDTLRTKVLPLLSDLGDNLSTGFFPAFLRLVGSVADFVRATLPGVKVLGEVLQGVSGALSSVVDSMSKLIGRMPGFEKLIGALAIGGAIAAGWGKVGLAFRIATAELARFLGLAKDIPILAPGRRVLFGRGGKADSEGMFLGGGGRGSGGAPGPYGGSAPGRSLPYMAQPGARYSEVTLNRTLAAARDAEIGGGVYGVQRRPVGGTTWRDPATGQFMPAFRPSFFDPRSQSYRRPSPIQAGSLALQRFRAGTFGGGALPVVPGPFMANPTSVRGGTGKLAAYESQLAALNNPGGKWLRRADNAADWARGASAGTAAGLRAAAAGLPKILGPAFGIAAVSGIIGGLSSGAKTGRGRLTDALSAATFGGFASEQQQLSNRDKHLYNNLAGVARNGPIMDVGRLVSHLDDSRIYSALGSKKDKVYKTLFGAGVGSSPGAGKVDLRDPKKVAALRLLNAAALKTGDISDEASAKFGKFLDDVGKKIDQLGPKLSKLKGALTSSLDFSAGSAGGARNQLAGVQALEAAFDSLGKSKGLSELKANASATIAAINGIMGKGSLEAKAALAQNFKGAADAVRDQMRRGVISTKTGMAEIKHFMILALHELGLTHNAADYLVGKDPLTGKPISGSSSGGKMGAASGAMMRVPGLPTGDRVSMNLGGRDVIVAPGEDIAVFNRHQRRALDERLADMGGLPGLFRNVRTPHHHSAMAGGGQVTGDTDYLPAVGAALRAMSRAKGVDINVASGRRTAGEQQALINRYGRNNPNHPVAGLNGPHVRGVAADINPGREVFGSIASKFGLGFTVPTESWHVQLVNALDAAGASVPSIKRVLSGLTGGLGAVVDGGLGRVRNAAQQRLQTLAEGLGASGGDGTAPSGGAAAPKGEVRSWLTKALRITGHYSEANLNALYRRTMQESGGNPSAINNWDSNAKAGDPSIGLLQTIGATFRAFMLKGHGNIRDPVDNAIAAIRYMFSQYGHVVDAGPGGYSMGGLVKAIGASTDLPPRNDGTPSVNTKDAITPGSVKKKKGAKGKLPGQAVGAYPNLKGVKAGKRKPFVPHLSKLTQKLLAPFKGNSDDFVANYATLFDKLYDSPLQHLDDLRANFEQRMTLEDNPSGELQMADLGTLLESFAKPALGLALGEQTVAKANVTRIRNEIGERLARVQQVQAVLAFDREEHARDELALETEQKHAGTWKSRVDDNDAKIKRLQTYKADLAAKAVGHSVTPEAQRARQRADGDISDLRGENAKLRKDKPASGAYSPGRATRLRRSVMTLGRNIRALSAGIPGMAQSVSDLGQLGVSNDALIVRLADVDVPKRQFDVDDLAHRIGLGPQNVDAASPDAAAIQAALDKALTENAIQAAQFKVFAGMQGMIGARMVGAFAHGGVIPETGMALVHKNETVVPAPDGPFYNRAAAAAQACSHVVEVHAHGDLGPLFRHVEATIDGKAAAIVSRQIGKRSRGLRSAPGGR